MERLEKQHRLMIAAGSEKIAAKIHSVLPNGFQVSVQTSMAAVKQKLTTSPCDILIVYTPLPDEFGMEASLQLATRYPSMGILMVVNSEVYNQTVYRAGDTGILVLARPLSANGLVSTLQIMNTVRQHIMKLEDENRKLTKKLEDERYVGRAKCLLIEREGMTESEAHKYLEREAMNASCTRREIALRVIRENGRIIIS